MSLIYRGIRYESQQAAVSKKFQASVPDISLRKYRLSNAHDANKIILIRPMHYYTYRGVCYTKNLVFNSQTKLLLDIDRQ
ncbi:MAG: DUF4278 domain-containing protein [Cyanobacteria bacterium P01_G01_bin.39]